MDRIHQRQVVARVDPLRLSRFNRPFPLPRMISGAKPHMPDVTHWELMSMLPRQVGTSILAFVPLRGGFQPAWHPSRTSIGASSCRRNPQRLSGQSAAGASGIVHLASLDIDHVQSRRHAKHRLILAVGVHVTSTNRLRKGSEMDMDQTFVPSG